MQISLQNKTFQLFLDEDTISKRISQLAQQLDQDYADKNPIFIVILNGAFIFAADLLRACQVQGDIEFVKLKSYESMGSTGEVKMILDLQVPIENRHIVIIEDIIDTGRTIHSFSKYLRLFHPASIHLVTCLSKPEALEIDLDIEVTVGFDISNLFVVGYGLDLDGQGRGLPAIYQHVG